MFFNSLKSRWAMLLGVALVSFTVIGCGSSGDDTPDDGAPGGNPPVVEDKVVITEENRDQVVSSPIWMVERAFAAGGIYFSGKDPSVNTAVMKSVANTIAARETEECGVDGSKTVDFDAESTMTTVYENCQEYEGGSIIHGTKTWRSSGNDITETFTDYHEKPTNDYSVEISFESATLKTTVDDEFNPLSGSSEINGYIKESGIQTDLENYQFVFKKDGNSLTFSMDGRIKSTPCLDKWIEVETVTDVKMEVINYQASCPTVGGVKVLGGNDTSLTMNFNADGSVDVSINGGSTEHYDSCDDLPDAEETCQGV